MTERDQESRVRYIAEQAHVQAQYFANHSVKSDEILGRKYLEEIQFLLSTIAALRKRVAELESDAVRYQFVRDRLEIRPRQFIGGATHESLDIRIACSRLDLPMQRNVSAESNAKLDAAIDTARSKLLDGELADKKGEG